jgi:hypothetical protein
MVSFQAAESMAAWIEAKHPAVPSYVHASCMGSERRERREGCAGQQLEVRVHERLLVLEWEVRQSNLGRENQGRC